MNDVLAERIRRSPPMSQREACAITVRQSIAALGVAAPADVYAVCEALAKGLFGPAFDAAPDRLQHQWTRLMQDEYRRATAAPGGSGGYS